jgi:FixJ family two-component response regulator
VPGRCTTDAKVCIVDDDRSILESLRGLLASEKIDAVTFDDPEQFLDYVQAHDLRVAILDVAMPGLSGIQLQKQLYRFSPETIVIIMTGRPDSEIRALALNGGASAFLAKPIDDETFLSSVRGVLDE